MKYEIFLTLCLDFRSKSQTFCFLHTKDIFWQFFMTTQLFYAFNKVCQDFSKQKAKSELDFRSEKKFQGNSICMQNASVNIYKISQPISFDRIT